MATKFLDDIGLAYFWSKIKSYIGTFIAAQDEVLTLSSSVTAGNRVTLPSGMQYRVGSNALQVSYNGTVCHIGKQFIEYGTSGSLSSQITLLLNAYSGDELGFRIQGTSDLSGTSVATSLPWASITSKPTEFTPSSHVHGNITNDGKLGTAFRVVVTNGNKEIGVSSITTTKLGYLTDVTANIQGQINGKADDSAVVHKTGNEGISGTKTFNSQIVGNIRKSVGNGSYIDMVQTYQSDNNDNRSCTIRCTNGDGYNTILIGAHDESNNAPNGLYITNTDGVLTGSFSGSLKLTRTTDASGTQDNSPALSIGSTSGTHLELDGNEIMAKSSGTTTGTLWINAQGGDVYIGGDSTDYKSVTGRGKGSSTVPVYTDANGIVTACGNSLAVGITGNAATATAFASSKAVTLTGAVTGTASSTGGWSVSTVWRSCIVGRNDSGTSNPWYKVASRTLTGGSSTYNITFYVENANTANKSFGILRASVGTNSDRTINAGITKFAWLANDGFAEEDFVLVCPVTAESTIELWTKVAIGYLRRRFVVISEGGNASTGMLWTLYDAMSAGQEASIPTEGTQVTSDYAIKTELSAKANDSAVVHNTGDEGISGVKYFSDTVRASMIVAQTADTSMILRSATPSSDGASLTLYNKNDTTRPGMLRAVPRNGSTYAILEAHPDGTFTWGGQPIQTSSDERLKTPLSSVPDAVLDAWEDVQWGSFRYLNAVERKGKSARLHLGLIAQRVKAIFEERSLDACAYGILCYDEEEDLWMVRYEEALAMEAACQRRRADRLEARIAAIEEMLK